MAADTPTPTSVEELAALISRMFGWSDEDATEMARTLFPKLPSVPNGHVVGLLEFFAERFIDKHGVDPRTNLPASRRH